MVRRGLEPSGFRGSDNRIPSSDNLCVNDPSEGESAEASAGGGTGGGGGIAGGVVGGGHHPQHAHRPTEENTTEDDDRDNDERSPPTTMTTTTTLDPAAVADEAIDEFDNNVNGEDDLSPANNVNGGLDGSFGREIKTHVQEDAVRDGEEDDGEVVLDDDDDDDDNNMVNGEVDDSQLDEEDEATTPADAPLDGTQQRHHQQQQQQQQSQLDAAEEASRALSRLQLQSSSATAAQSPGVVVPPSPGANSGAVVPLGTPPDRTPSPQLLDENGEITGALTVLPPNELSTTTTEAAMAANTFADMMGGHDAVGWGHHDGIHMEGG
eukprot:CAMPEP_0196133152 /NCGR_PEP_ID=MMETSP0910-20130528/2494_1 /TAXON_ID=49265 /ORGANISM="Thalassiosira rotula, Strain GSO102" /LENGTH=322 /DNA_ID=CAMNT_0041392847 /DNA_START=399 /DNA_END=1363 /DNA_ORIENTATION=-